jgi:2,4-dienoyl-CoA reductase-like NADH-dependent reductase (Old Yellow Enzyme family)
MIHVSSWEYGKGLRNDWPAGSHPTKLIRDALPAHVPVIGVGGLFRPEQMISLLDDGVDLAALGRVLLLNTDLVAKIRQNRADEIVESLYSEQQREQLDLPPQMIAYTRRFFIVSK